MEVKQINNNHKILYWLLGFVMGYVLSIILSVGASASDFKYQGMFDTLPNRDGWQNIVVEDLTTGTYYLYSLDSVNVSVNYDFLMFGPTSDFSKGGTYFWSTQYNEWTVSSYSYPSMLLLGDNSYKIVHSDIDILYGEDDENAGEVYFYKTKSIISNKLFQGVNTVLYQKLMAVIKIIVPVVLVVLASMVVVYILPKVLYKFF